MELQPGAHQHTVAVGAGESRVFHFETTWEIPCPGERVWEAIADVSAWPQWWPGVRCTTVHRAAQDRHGNGTTADVMVASPLGYRLRFTIRIRDAHKPVRATIEVTGDLRGTGWWEAVTGEDEVRGTRVRIVWCVVTQRSVVRLLRPAAPLAHGLVMRAGQAGLRRQLRSKR